MLQDLDKTLKVLLLSELPEDYASRVFISFCPPDSTQITAGNKLPAINLFLYDIKEDDSRRQVVPEISRLGDGSVTRTWPPAIVDCHYLITAWSGADGDARDADEHQLLGEVMKVLIRFRAIPMEVLQGELAAIGLPVTSWLIQSDRVRSLGEFWQAVGGKPRAMLSYVVTLQVPMGTPELTGRAVTDVQV